MKKNLAIAFGCLSLVAQAQLFTLSTPKGPVAVPADEFEYVFNKNKDIGKQIDPKTPQEYLDLYIAFKRKVAEATVLEKDQVPAFQQEYQSYYKQLVKPYMTDKLADARILEEAYERLQTDVHAAHIMLDLAEDALPEDTARVYQELVKIRQRLVNGEDFGTLAQKISSDTYSAQRNGDLGWFTAFQMVYPFESAAYNTPVGQISMPVRSLYGYHLVKVIERRPARYKMEAAHILLMDNPENPSETNAEAQIKALFEQLNTGADFSELAKTYSMDKTSAKNQGRLPVFGMNDMLPEFEEAVFNLTSDGAYTAPFKTKIGWHIAQRIRKVNVPALADIKSELEAKIRRDARSNASKTVYLNQLRASYALKSDPKALKKILATVDSNFTKGTWNAPSPSKKWDKPLATLTLPGTSTTKEFSQWEALQWLQTIQVKPRPGKNAKTVAYEALSRRLDDWLLTEEEALLPSKFPAFRFLANEYKEGILVFELTREMVWDKASKDTAGLNAFFEANKNAYSWNERRSGQVYQCVDEATASKLLRLLNKGTEPTKAVSLLSSKNPLAVRLTTVDAEKGSQNLSREQELLLSAKATGLTRTSPTELVWVKSLRAPEPKAMREVRGAVIADYQKTLEQQWMESLKNKYPVTIDAAAWQSLQEKLSRP
jgi:peptidyl-prolyl cis-trans isomerase SurA